jgi:hypothetical protein
MRDSGFEYYAVGRQNKNNYLAETQSAQRKSQGIRRII